MTQKRAIPEGRHSKSRNFELILLRESMIKPYSLKNTLHFCKMLFFDKSYLNFSHSIMT